MAVNRSRSPPFGKEASPTMTPLIWIGTAGSAPPTVRTLQRTRARSVRRIPLPVTAVCRQDRNRRYHESKCRSTSSATSLCPASL